MVDDSNDRVQRFEEIKQRLDAVRGPWRLSTRRIWDDDVPCVVCADFEEADDQVRMNTEEWDKHALAEREAVVAQAPIEPHGDASDGFIDMPATDAAMKFIAHSWSDIKWLLEQVE